MESPKIFISYSRANKLYVSSLVSAFRAEGFSVWFDKNIKTGEEWDNTIEREIKNADAMVLILSETSVASDNVKDEMSYAMSLGKPLNPVKIEDCDVPMRLARKQYIDFTKLGSERGFEKLVEDLKNQLDITNLQRGTQEKTVFNPIIDPKKPSSFKEETPAPSPMKASHRQEKTNIPVSPSSNHTSEKKDKKQSKLPFVIGGILLVSIITYFAMSLQDDTTTEVSSDETYSIENAVPSNESLSVTTNIGEEQIDFNTAATSKTIEAYQAYLDKYPHGFFLERASDSIEKILKVKDLQDSLVRVQKRAEDWITVQEKHTLDDYIVFIKTYESGSEVEKAKIARAELETALENKKRDDRLWKVIESNPSVTAYLDYYTDNSIEGLHKDKVFRKVDSIGKQGYLFYGRSGYDSLSTSSVFDVICCAEGPVNHNKMPEKNDVLLIESAVRTYYDSKRNRPTGSVLNVGKKAIVKDVQIEGKTAIIVRIAY